MYPMTFQEFISSVLIMSNSHAVWSMNLATCQLHTPKKMGAVILMFAFSNQTGSSQLRAQEHWTGVGVDPAGNAGRERWIGSRTGTRWAGNGTGLSSLPVNVAGLWQLTVSTTKGGQFDSWECDLQHLWPETLTLRGRRKQSGFRRGQQRCQTGEECEGSQESASARILWPVRD